MKYIIALVISFSAIPSFAAITSVQGGLSMVNSILAVSLDVDYQKKRSHSFGGFFVFGQKEEGSEPGDQTREGFFALGGDLKVFFGPKNWKVYIAPGIGFISHDRISDESETTFGTIFKTGGLIRVGANFYIGLEQMYLQNWFGSKSGGNHFLTSASVRVNF